MLTSMTTDACPRVLGPYVLLAPLAHGGMGTVYIAAFADKSASRELLLVKTLKAGIGSASDYRERFLDESRVAVHLRHDNLCRVFLGGEDHGEFYLAMELIEGITVRRLLSLAQQRDRQLSMEQATAIAISVLRGLHAAHETKSDGKLLGVVHRDVSPHNAMVDTVGRVKVIDFGLATSVLKETFTESAVVLGKSAYMAPEQARGEDVTPVVDQYAAAIMLYELLTDDRYYGDLPSRSIWAVVGAGTHKPRRWADVPAPFSAILDRALAPDPAKRFPSCKAFADALAQAMPSAVTQETHDALGKIVRRLKPDELDAIAAARLALAAWDAIPRAQTDTSGTSTRPLHLVDEEGITAETSASVITRGTRVPPPKRSLRAASLGVMTVVTAAVVAVMVGRTMREPPAPPPEPVVVATPVLEAPPVEAPPVEVAPVEVVPVIEVVEAPPEPVVEVVKKPVRKAPPTLKQRAMQLRASVKGCAHSCVGLLYEKDIDSLTDEQLQALINLAQKCQDKCK